jgi:hypothetical protein
MHDWLHRLARQPVGLLGGGDGDRQITEMRRAPPLCRQAPRQKTQPTLRPQFADCGGAEPHREIEGAHQNRRVG